MRMHYPTHVVEKGIQALDAIGLTELHHRLLSLVPPGSRVLEVGCAAGHLSRALREHGCRVTGVEQVPRLAELARDRVDLLIQGDIEQPDVAAQVPADHDVVLLADVIEHFADPWATVRAFAAKAEPGALWLVTFPNIAHWTIRRDLLFGRWQYTDFGIMDQTHLRFFCYDSARQFLHEAGLVPDRVEVSQCAYPLRPTVLKRAPGLDAWLQERLPNLVGAQFLAVARQSPP